MFADLLIAMSSTNFDFNLRTGATEWHCLRKKKTTTTIGLFCGFWLWIYVENIDYFFFCFYVFWILFLELYIAVCFFVLFFFFVSWLAHKFILSLYTFEKQCVSFNTDIDWLSSGDDPVRYWATDDKVKFCGDKMHMWACLVWVLFLCLCVSSEYTSSLNPRTKLVLCVSCFFAVMIATIQVEKKCSL